MSIASKKIVAQCFENMSKIFREKVTAQGVEKLPVFDKIAKKISEEVLVKALESENLSSDSLDEVSHYMGLALKAFQKIDAPLLNVEQRAKFLFAVSETYETIGNYQR